MSQIQLKSDLKVLPKVIDLGGFFIGTSNRIYVYLTDDGEEVSPVGNITAFIIQSDGNTITIAGGISNNMIYVDLPSEVYEVPGSVQIAIRIGNTTVACCNGYVPFNL